MQIDRIETDRRRSRAVRYNGLIFVSGQVADNRGDDIVGQMKQVLGKVEGFLVAAGGSRNRILSAQIYLSDLDRDFTGMNSVWDEWFALGSAPTRITVQAKLGAPDVLVEVTCVGASG